MKKNLIIFVLIFCSIINIAAETITYESNSNQSGISLKESSDFNLKLSHSINKFSFQNLRISNEDMKKITLPGVLLPNNEGAPNLPGISKFVAVPEGAKVKLNILNREIETMQNIEIAPAPKIPLDTDDSPLVYKKDNKIYSNNSFYPAEPVVVSEITELRGVNMVKVGITPFQYNPVTKELQIIKNIDFEIEFIGGSRKFGEDRLRSRWWDSITNDMFINSNQLSKIDYSSKNMREEGWEYLIISPDDETFLNWADSLKNFRSTQGIKTKVFTVNEIGGNNINSIETFIDDAYANWEIPPVAVLLMADHGSSATEIISPTRSHPYSGSCISDNKYADVDGDHLPDIAFARLTARNNSELENMIMKIIRNERVPSTNADFYNNPVTACGWQTERWFQIASETIGGFWKNELGKDQVRINAIYDGNPNTIWSTAENTNTVVDYFGPDGLNYIPETPGELGGFSGGNATDVNNALNSGAFMLQHRDHGGIDGWGEPAYGNGNLSGLDNDDFPFIFSINCLTGKFDDSSESFAEAMHRMNKGALGLIAATEISYSFVNDTFIWGLYDSMWPEFMPEFGANPETNGILPAFANVSGKYFLEQSSWPYNTESKEITYYLFHHHGDPFTSVYSEMPETLAVTHNEVILSGTDFFEVTADEGALISLSVDNEVIGTAVGTGSSTMVTIEPQIPPTNVKLVVTKQNHYRHEEYISVIPPSGPYVVFDDYTINDATGNNNGLADYSENLLLDFSVLNVGNESVDNVNVVISSTDEFITIVDSTEIFGTVNSQENVNLEDVFEILIADTVPNNHTISFNAKITSDTDEWNSSFSIKCYSPILEYQGVVIDDSAGNNNGRLDAGETVNFDISLQNIGSSLSKNILGTLNCDSEYITIDVSSNNYGDLDSEELSTESFTVTTSADTPIGYQATFTVDFSDEYNYSTNGSFSSYIGQVPFLIVNLDPNSNSAPSIEESLNNTGIYGETVTSLPTEELNLYSSIFVCLGIYSNNTQLSSPDGDLLAEYLSNGGNLYMEGGDTWAFDTQTAVHSMFNINGDSDGSSDLSTVNGNSETFTNGMTFSYSGENNWIDQLSPQGDAVTIFSNNAVGYDCAIANHAENYNTIGASFEFGGLDDATSPSTKDNLIAEYMTFFGLYNDDTPDLNPVKNLTATISAIGKDGEENDITLNWETPDSTSAIFNGYNVYRNNEILTENSIQELTFEDLDLPDAVYTYSVEAVYEEGNSIKVDVEIEVDAELILPPENLVPSLDENNLTLAWEAPNFGGNESEYLYYDNGENNDAIGLTEGGTFNIAAKWDNLNNFNSISKVKIFMYSETADYTLKIWKGANASEEIYSETLSNYTAAAWNEFELSNPIAIEADTEYWIGYNLVHEAEDFAAGCDAGPAVSGYGDMISTESGVWVSMSTEYGLDFNWNLRVYVSTEAGVSQILSNKKEFNTTPNSERFNSVQNKVVQGNFKKIEDTKIREMNLTGYKVYKDDNVIALISDPETLTYVENNIAPGTYSYYVTAIYNETEESAPTNTIEVVITEENEIHYITSLGKNYPNPFTNSTNARNIGTRINFSLNENSFVKMNIYNVKGQLVKVLGNKEFEAGNNTIFWNGKNSAEKNSASGIYFYKMTTKNYNSIGKMLLIK